MRPDELTDYDLELLGVLQEECAEVIQIVSKIRRFRLHSYNPFEASTADNRQLLAQELGDVTALIKLLKVRSKLFTQPEIDQAAELKQKKLEKFLNQQNYHKSLEEAE